MLMVWYEMLVWGMYVSGHWYVRAFQVELFTAAVVRLCRVSTLTCA